MKTINSFIFLPFLIILLLVTSVESASDWVEFGRYNNGDVISYNKVSIKYMTKDMVQVWCKDVFSDEGREENIQYMRNKGISTEGWNKLSHGLILVEIDCKKERNQSLNVTYYDTDGKVLYRNSYDKRNWDDIPPGLIFDNLRKKVCK